MKVEKERSLKAFLEERVSLYNQPSFINRDPISIPHLFSMQQDIEISGLFAAIFSWGNRTTIIRKARELMRLMDDSPYDFIINHQEEDLKGLLGFTHRTFNTTDLLYFITFLRGHYKGEISPGMEINQPGPNGITLESAFANWMNPSDRDTGKAISGFHNYFFSLEDAPGRTRKHMATPTRKSSCKRLNMFLRWMVRSDDHGVDFGIWRSIRPAQLVCPLDLHVVRVSRRFGLLRHPRADWAAALEITGNLKRMDPIDPVKYDFALFGLGIEERF